MSQPAEPIAHEKSRLLDRWLRQQAKTVRKPINRAIALGSVNGLLLIGQAWALAIVLNATAVEHHPLSSVWPWIAAMLAIFLLRAVINRAAGRQAFEAGADLRLQLRQALFEHIERLGPAWTRQQRSGAIATTAVDGIEALEKFVTHYLPQSQLAAIIPIVILVFVFPNDWISGLVLMLTAPLLPVFMIIIGSQTEKLNQRQWRTLARMSAHFFDAIEGLTTLKLFNAARREARVVGQIADDYRRQTMKVLRVAFLSSLVLEFLGSISIAMVAVLVGFRLLYGDIHYLNGLFVLLLAPEFYQPLRGLGTQFHARMDAIAAAEQIGDLLSQSPRPDAQREDLDNAAHNDPEPTDDRTEPAALAFEQVRFGYDPAQPVIGELNLTLKQGTRTALIGASGAGKSTIAQLVLGFLNPDDGRIRYGGQDIRDISVDQWRDKLAWMPQSPTLFHGSIAGNIALDMPADRLDAPEMRQAIRLAAKQAKALTFIEALPDGFDTLIGDRGQGLSGGQIQRIALARAFYKDAAIVILDEPTASLDHDSERLVTEAVERLAEGRILLIIAHRLQTIAHCDQVVVLDQGRIVEQGTPQQLHEQDGHYARLLRQYAGDSQGQLESAS